MAKRKMSTFERLQRGKWSREQRKELAQKLEAADLTIVHPDAAGIDVGNESHSWRCRQGGTLNRYRSSDRGRRICNGWRHG